MSDEELRSLITERLYETNPLYYEDAADDLSPVIKQYAAAQAAVLVHAVHAVCEELSKPVDYEVTQYRDGLRDAARQVRDALAVEATP